MSRYSGNDQAGVELPKAKLDRESLKQALELFRYLRPYLGRFSATMASLFTGSLLSLAFPYLAGSIVDAAAHEFIQAFPEGYATLVVDRGIKLSGGQRQREPSPARSPMDSQAIEEYLRQFFKPEFRVLYRTCETSPAISATANSRRTGRR